MKKTFGCFIFLIFSLLMILPSLSSAIEKYILEIPNTGLPIISPYDCREPMSHIKESYCIKCHRPDTKLPASEVLSKYFSWPETERHRLIFSIHKSKDKSFKECFACHVPRQ